MLADLPRKKGRKTEMAGVVILVLSSRSAVKRIGNYFYRPVCAAIIVSETKSKTGAFSASAYFDQRRLCGGGSYGSPAFLPVFFPEVSFFPFRLRCPVPE